MRSKLVQNDWVECVIGLGKNLFYNSPMEACIVICRMNKPVERKNKILFINAKHEVTRKNAQSFLEEKHIDKIAQTYFEYVDEEGFSHVADLEEIQKNQYELTISLYVDDNTGVVAKPVETAISDWLSIMRSNNQELEHLQSLIVGGKSDA